MRLNVSNWLISLLVLLVLSNVVDLKVAHFFFDETQSFSNGPLYDKLYVWGLVPGWSLAVAALILLLRRHYLKEAVYLLLVLAIGSGLITHLFLKEGWPRPRPKQVEEFGGNVPFHTLYQPKFSGKEKHRSFPSGHATIGFYPISLLYIGKKYQKKSIIIFSFVLCSLVGGALSWLRMAQGGHFLTDVLGALWIMWGTSAFLSPILNTYERTHSKTA